MSDDELIRRGDALSAIQLGDTVAKMQARIAAIPYVAADPVCTGCGGTGITYQTERRCACQGPDLSDPVVVHANMLRGTIAKPTVEQIIHLYGVDALTKALAPVIVREAGIEPVAAPAEDAAAKGETDGETLERLGMDGAKWAAEFRTTALRLGYSDMDEGWLIGWFCNAVMAGYDRSPAPDPAAIREAWEKAYWRMRSYAVHDNDCKLNKPPHFNGPCSCGLTAALEEALALTPKGSAEPTEYERKVAQMKKDFPNGI